jgi:hypothetical protein
MPNLWHLTPQAATGGSFMDRTAEKQPTVISPKTPPESDPTKIDRNAPAGMTERISISLGHKVYRNALEAESMSLVGTHRDEGENHYYFAFKNVGGADLLAQTSAIPATKQEPHHQSSIRKVTGTGL